jgi:hypothetical protein
MIREREEREQRENREEESQTAVAAANRSEKKKADSVSMRDPLRGRYIDISL